MLLSIENCSTVVGCRQRYSSYFSHFCRGALRNNNRFRFRLLLTALFVALCRISSVTSLSVMMSSTSRERPSQYYPRFFEKQIPSMSGKSVVITGCSKGLGFVTAKALAQKGAMVYMLNRKSERLNSAKDAITAVSTGPHPKIIDCDLLDFASVRRAAAKIKESATDGIDVLCNNAGIMLQEDLSSVDGYDITASTNMLSHFLLTKELINELEKASSARGEARIVNMSSISGYGPPAFNPEFFECRGGNCGGPRASYERYHQSKLANLAFTAALDDRLRARVCKIKALACTPGVCGTDMYTHATTVMHGAPSPLDGVPSVEDGCMAQLKCICDKSVKSGDLWGPSMGRSTGGELIRTEIKLPTILVDKQAKDSLWKVCEEAVGEFKI